MVRLLSFALLLSLVVLAARPAMAQDPGVTSHKPRFLAGWSAPGIVVDASNVAVLQRRVTLDVDEQPLDVVLRELARQTRLDLSYDPARLPAGRTVSLHVRSITMLAALTEVLVNTGLDVVVQRGGQLALVPAVRVGADPTAAGSIAGRVTDAASGEGVSGVELRVAGLERAATTDESGAYAIRDVPPGEQRVTARRIGYRPQTQTVTVIDGQTATLDFALVAQPTQLDEVVTTVTGEQRLRELGHVVGRINADSLVKEAPVSSLTDLLNGRVPGLMVFQNQGTVGGQANLRIRGPNSLIMSPEPIIVVDGVRYTNTQRPMGGSTTFGPGFVEGTSPLNDINVNDIESVEVVKGPSAATLYGSDAANGVLVITTKRGRPGPARWNVYAKGTTTAIPEQQYPDLYWGWGTVFGVPDNTQWSCTLAWLAGGLCTQQDSITVLPNPLNNPDLTIFAAKPRWEYGLNLSGGRQDLRYYFSGDFEDATGPLQMPTALVEQLKAQRGLSELPEEWREPNAFTKLNLRSNITAVLSEAAELRLSSGYVQSSTRSFGAFNAYSDGMTAITPTTSYGPRANPAESFLRTSTEESNRFYGSATGQWQVWPWLTMRSTVGLDLTSSNRHSVVRRGDAPNDAFSPNGAVEEDQGRQAVTTAELGVTATVRRGRLSSRTSAGAQYVRGWTNALFSSGRDLPPGGTTIGQALMVQSRQSYSVHATLGSYVEETVGLNDRLFLTGALRLDGASTFGRNYETVLYPKLSASWLLSDEPFMPRIPGFDELRLRYAFGAAGRQPLPRWGLPSFGAGQAIVDGVVTRTIANQGLGNPDLRPERVREHEFGFDAGALERRLSLSLTWFRRRTRDQIVDYALPNGFGNTYANLGLTTQRGFEAELTAQVLASRLLSWDVSFQHSSVTTYLVDLGRVPGRTDRRGGWVEGYPLGARFDVPLVGYTDANGDGILNRSDPAELQRGDTAIYLGQSTPPKSQTLTSVVGLFDRRLRLSTLLERRAGFTQINPFRCRSVGASCRELVDPNTPLEAQFAAHQAASFVPEQGDFIRLREISATVVVPEALTRALRLGSATLALSARNLALWTDFTGPDPESARLAWESELGAVRGNEATGVPQGRSYMLRLDVGF